MLDPEKDFRMTTTWVLITDMAILAGIFALGFLAKSFPKNGRGADSHHSSQHFSQSGSPRDSNSISNTNVG
jgi:hypothetical protein